MKKLFTAIVCCFAASVAFAAPTLDEMSPQAKVYYNTITWPIMKRLDACQGPSLQKQFRGDKAKCYAVNVKWGLRYQSLDEFKAEAREMAYVSGKIAAGEWKIVTAETPEEYPLWGVRCGQVITGNDWVKVEKLDDEGLPVVDADGNPVMVNQRAPGRPVTTFEECWAAVEKWSSGGNARQTYPQYFTKSWIRKEDGTAYDLQREPALPEVEDPTLKRNLLGRYAFQPGWAAKLGFVNPRFAQSMWQSAMPTIKSKLAAIK